MKPDSKPRILYGITKSNFGGAQKYVYELAAEAKKRGYHVNVLCGGKGVLTEKLKKEGIYTFFIKSLVRDISIWKDFKSFFEILSCLQTHKPDIFHINSSKMGVMGALAGRITGVPKIIFTAHGWAFNEPKFKKVRSLAKFVYWFSILLSHHTICVSEQIKKDVEDLPFVKEKLVLIKNGIKEFDLIPQNDARQHLLATVKDGTFLAGVLSELHKIKGLDILLLAWQEFKKDKDTHLVILGTGEEKENLEKIAKDLGIESSVHFLGYVDNAKSYLPGLDVFLMPSRSEGLPYALLEAGLSKRPVIATNIGGIPEIIKDSQNGILFEKENATELSQDLEKIYSDRNLRKTLAENLFRTISTEYSFDQMAERTFGLYQA